jgi:hypothetical protein
MFFGVCVFSFLIPFMRPNIDQKAPLPEQNPPRQGVV